MKIKAENAWLHGHDLTLVKCHNWTPLGLSLCGFAEGTDRKEEDVTDDAAFFRKSHCCVTSNHRFCYEQSWAFTVLESQF